MDSQKEILYWSRMNNAVSSFCLKQSLNRLDNEEIACSILGDGLEWCGSQSYLFMAQKLLDQEQSIMKSEKRILEIEEKCKMIEGLLSKETGVSSNLKKQLKQAQLNAEDNEWQLQEQLAQMNNILQLERENYTELKNELSITQGKLVEVEMYLNSDRGAITLQLERELADSRLKISELEAEKDVKEMELMKRNKLMNTNFNTNIKENINPRMNNINISQ